MLFTRLLPGKMKSNTSDIILHGRETPPLIWKVYFLAYTQNSKGVHATLRAVWRQQVASLTTMAQINQRLRLLLESNTKGNNGIQYHCNHNLIRGHCCEPAMTSIHTVATMCYNNGLGFECCVTIYPNTDLCSHCCKNVFQQWACSSGLPSSDVKSNRQTDRHGGPIRYYSPVIDRKEHLKLPRLTIRDRTTKQEKNFGYYIPRNFVIYTRAT
jgi:hypothetical protein